MGRVAAVPKTVIKGAEISYKVSGDGPTVLFTHGYQASGAMWDPQRKALEGRYRVITWDLRGHGDSTDSLEESHYSQELMLEDMGALIDEAGASQAVLVGHSLGGFTSLRFYLQHPERVRALVLVGSGPGFRDPEAREKWNGMAERFAVKMETDGLDVLKKATAEVSGAKHRSGKALALAARRMLTQHDSKVMDAIADIDVPTLVMIGQEDKPFIGSSEYMAKKIPGAQMVTIAGGGHAVTLEQPDAFNAALLEFLDNLPA
jgi:pimeloyl-ACP methyl ester carboxylesterase